MPPGIAVSLVLVAAFGLGLASFDRDGPRGPATGCSPAVGWSIPGGEPIDGDQLLDHIAGRSVVLLGERHDAAEHHRWQLETLRALHRRRPDIVLALEMFPRRVQDALDAWVRGELDEEAFLERSDWANVWRFDPDLYLDIFRYARDHAIPMRAINVESSFTRAVGRNGFDAVPPEQREGVSRPAEPGERYTRWLRMVHRLHHPTGQRGGRRAQRHFIEAQLVWDRAMAQGLRDAATDHPGALVVALIGSGHLLHGDGVAHQLDDLGLKDHATLLPWDRRSNCRHLVAGVADAIYGLDDPDDEPAS